MRARMLATLVAVALGLVDHDVITSRAFAAGPFLVQEASHVVHLDPLTLLANGGLTKGNSPFDGLIANYPVHGQLLMPVSFDTAISPSSSDQLALTIAAPTPEVTPANAPSSDTPGAVKPAEISSTQEATEPAEPAVNVVKPDPITQHSVVNAPVEKDPVSDNMMMPSEINGVKCPELCNANSASVECIVPRCKMCPCRYGYVEGLLVTRNNRSIKRPLVRDINTGDVLLDGQSPDFDWNGGLRAVLGKRICDDYYLEVGYLGNFDQVGSRTITGNNNLIVDGDLGLTVNNFGLANEVTLRYESRVHSVEANIACCCCDCDSPTCGYESVWLFGYRYLDFDERFHLISTDLQESTTDYNVHTRNKLYGGQMGRRVRACRGKWSFETAGKGGVYGNGASQTSAAIIDFPNFLFRPATSASVGDVAFVGEFNFTGVYHLNETWGIRSGYNLLWIEGLALASDQLDFSDTPDSGTAIYSDGEVLLHGFSWGLEARW